ncbi:hypothetical protein [Magnetofaba australis]|uniref:Uncharacterized protein n=1 Tax=Magnetofaba australis IT-1 TaxID=1434232 RepID=A0A1Y2K0C6_9PROT|nr:hypothetical protein [Magnetofaba australis]OSM01493.1 hypothetical protein MAIT1_01474 [Magnetofaba australis IT-1]
MSATVNVEQWVAMFQQIGLNEAQMQQWHEIFEANHPEAHGAFLNWLGMPQEQITQVRQHSASKNW